MNPVTDIVFSLTWLLLLIWAIRSMARGWTAQPTNKIHPEMVDVKEGEELLGVTFKPSSCDLEEYQDLQNRIEKLREELADPWDEDDDDDGDVPAVTRR